MALSKHLAFYDLRDWWLSDARMDELLMTDRRVRAKNPMDADPFYPVSQQPGGGFPYARYTVARTVAPQWWMHVEQVGIDLYMHDIDESTEVLNTFIDMAGRYDESARDLNRWLQQRHADQKKDFDDGLIDEDEIIPIEFEFHVISYVGGGDIGATSEEGGTHSRIMMFNIEYSPLEGRGIR
jgi:hypothetical protein